MREEKRKGGQKKAKVLYRHNGSMGQEELLNTAWSTGFHDNLDNNIKNRNHFQCDYCCLQC